MSETVEQGTEQSALVKFPKNRAIQLAGYGHIEIDTEGRISAFVGEKATAYFRLRMILHGLEMEVKNPGFRLTSKTPKCTTIVKTEFGLTGNPVKLLEQFREIMKFITPASQGIEIKKQAPYTGEVVEVRRHA
jgi:hypothetical protein